MPMMAPNGTRFGGWLLNTADNHFGTVADYDGDGRASCSSPARGASASWSCRATSSTRRSWRRTDAGSAAGCSTRLDNRFGPVGDFDGDGRAEILVTSPWGIGVLKQSGPTLSDPMLAPNGTRFGGWLLNTADNYLTWWPTRRRRPRRDPGDQPVGHRHPRS